MKKRIFNKVIALFLTVMMAVGIFPMIAHADETEKRTIGDAVKVLRYIAGTSILSQEEQQTFDLDFNGKITIGDAVIILRVLAGTMEMPKPNKEYGIFKAALDKLNDAQSCEMKMSMSVEDGSGASYFTDTHIYMSRSGGGDIMFKMVYEGESELGNMVYTAYYSDGYLYFDYKEPLNQKIKIPMDLEDVLELSGAWNGVTFPQSAIITSSSELVTEAYVDETTGSFTTVSFMLDGAKLDITSGGFMGIGFVGSFYGDISLTAFIDNDGQLRSIKTAYSIVEEGFDEILHLDVTENYDILSVNQTTVTLPDDLDEYEEFGGAF